MASAYPGSLDTFATNRANATATANTHPTDHNDVADAVNKIEAELGTDPAGAAATVKARLSAVEATTFNYGSNAADVVWGSAIASGTVVTVTGGQTLAEQDGLLGVQVTSTIADSDLNALLYAKTISVGDFWAVPFRWMHPGANSHVGVVFTDGTTSGANAVATCIQYSADTGLTLGRSGTLTVLSTNSGAFETIDFDTPMWLGLKYVAANSFAFYFSTNGFLWTASGATGLTPTITPTHVGVGWSNWGVTTVKPQITFGALRKQTAP